MEQLSRAALEANLTFADTQLREHIGKEGPLRDRIRDVERQIRELTPVSTKERFQAVFDEENFLDAIWYLQDEPEIKEAALQFHKWKQMLEKALTDMGIKFQ